MEAKIKKISEFSKLLSVKTRMSDDLFHRFDRFGIGHLLSRLHWVSASELILSLSLFLGETLGVIPQHLMATISGKNKAMCKILVMAKALEKWNEVYGHTA